MADVLVIDDLNDMRESHKGALVARGHTVHFPSGPNLNAWVKSATEIVDGLGEFVLVLDLNLNKLDGGEIWGGIWFYVRMRDRGALDRCKGVIVASRYIPRDVRSLKSLVKPTDAFVARVFVELEQIPQENIFKTDERDAFSEIARRISELLP